MDNEDYVIRKLMNVRYQSFMLEFGKQLGLNHGTKHAPFTLLIQQEKTSITFLLTLLINIECSASYMIKCLKNQSI